MTTPRDLEQLLFAISEPRPVRFWLALLEPSDFDVVRHLDGLEGTVVGAIWRDRPGMDVTLSADVTPTAFAHLLAAAVADLYANRDTPARRVASYHVPAGSGQLDYDRETLADLSPTAFAHLLAAAANHAGPGQLDYDRETLEDFMPGIRRGAELLLKRGPDTVPADIGLDLSKPFADAFLGVLRAAPVVSARIGGRDMPARVLMDEPATWLHHVARFLQAMAKEGSPMIRKER